MGLFIDGLPGFGTGAKDNNPNPIPPPPKYDKKQGFDINPANIAGILSGAKTSKPKPDAAQPGVDYKPCDDCGVTNIGACFYCARDYIVTSVEFLGINLLFIIAVLVGVFLIASEKAEDVLTKTAKVAEKIP